MAFVDLKTLIFFTDPDPGGKKYKVIYETHTVSLS
jgi:hypothetical protein